jgi:hypothetical protein
MTILDDLAAIARERHFGHESVQATERPLCRISRIPPDWCLGCRRGWHKFTLQPLPGSEPEEVMEVTDPPEPCDHGTATFLEFSCPKCGETVKRDPAQSPPSALTCACGAPLWFLSERASGRCFNCMPPPKR